MRYHLVDRGGTTLGEVLLAEGVTLAVAGRALISGQPLQLVEAGDRERELVASAAGGGAADDKKASKKQ